MLKDVTCEFSVRVKGVQLVSYHAVSCSNKIPSVTGLIAHQASVRRNKRFFSLVDDKLKMTSESGFVSNMKKSDVIIFVVVYRLKSPSLIDLTHILRIYDTWDLGLVEGWGWLVWHSEPLNNVIQP